MTKSIHLSSIILLTTAAMTAPILWAETISRQFTPLPTVPEDALTRKGEIVMTELYQTMGMEFPANKKKSIEPPTPPTPKPSPAPTPQPEPKPKPKNDAFWEDDDDFFDEDKGFDEIAKGFDENFDSTVAGWNKEYEETLQRWGLAEKQYIENKNQYMLATYDFEKFDTGEAQTGNNLATADRSTRPTQPGDFHIIPYAFTQNVQDQAGRGTCAAFAGVKAIETLISQREVNTIADTINLSEQQFFYLARVDCIEQPCRPEFDPKGRVKNDGSTFDLGFKVNKTVAHKDASLMSEQYCLYRPVINDNVTYSPLQNYCQVNSGGQRYRVASYSTKIPVDNILSELNANRPVAAGFKLPNSFFNAKGLVSLVDPNTGQGTGPHTGGHAVALIGYVLLPETYWAIEGKYCVVTSNSWGEGWGKGGYACITEKWMKKFYMYSTSISQVNQVQL
ncbi:C1 family peptidase [Oceanicoccus sp. KOV_DT_Chl]|uniref:C1 family peptidase n=1 Tax=Oceanicoccus sp. KOV_DT_Chl TaxID=1904639 RepID=UPI001357A4BE|nr:C1 family peptidase [Oceanicoccus sp. KOV_DT_Chl]